MAWLTAGGYIRPDALSVLKAGEFAHSKYQEFLNQPHRGNRKYVLVAQPPFMNGNSFITEAPLDYDNLTKLTGALRENNMANVREATKLYEGIIQNRRLAIVFLLNKAFEQKKDLEWNKLVEFFKKNQNKFVVNLSSLEDCLEEEVKIAFMSGIPFSFLSNNDVLSLHPLTGINTAELLSGAPKDVVEILKSMVI